MYVAQPVKGIVNRLLGAMEVDSIWVRLELAAIGNSCLDHLLFK